MSTSSAPVSPGSDFDEKAFLQRIPYPITATTVKGSYAGVAPAEDFDPNTASAAALVKNGILLRRPTATDDPALQAAWRKTFSRKWLAQDYVVPVLAPQIGRTHQLRRAPTKTSEGNYLGYAWAGAATASGGPYTGVIANWVVPSVSKASEPASSAPSYDSTVGIAYDSSSWIGIDGFDFRVVSNDVLQAGVEQYVDTAGKAHYVAWYEWFTAGDTTPPYVYQTNIANFPITAGNEVSISVQYQGKTAGYIYFGNVTTGKYTSVTLAPPPGATFSGNTVEWIVEDPDEGEFSNTALAKFTPVTFSSAIACTASGGTNNPQSDNTCNIETLGGKVLTKVALGSYTVTVDFIG